MLKLNNTILVIILTILTCFIGFYGLESYKLSKIVDNNFVKISKINYIDNKLGNVYNDKKEILKNETSILLEKSKNFIKNKYNKYTNNDKIHLNLQEKKINLIKVLESKSIVDNNTLKNSYLKYFGLIFIILVLLITSLKIKILNTNIILFFTIMISIISLLIGLFTTMITVEVFKELPIIGHTVLKYELKSIYDTIYKLIITENYIIAILISLFSIIIPVIKTLLMFASLLIYKSIAIIDKLGKWSMADVFIVSIFISILSLNSDAFTKAEIGVGIYFFSTYVLLSLISSFIITSRRNHKIKELNYLIKSFLIK